MLRIGCGHFHCTGRVTVYIVGPCIRGRHWRRERIRATWPRSPSRHISKGLDEPYAHLPCLRRPPHTAKPPLYGQARRYAVDLLIFCLVLSACSASPPCAGRVRLFYYILRTWESARLSDRSTVLLLLWLPGGTLGHIVYSWITQVLQMLMGTP
jgi:hypothetical protein